MDESGKLIAVIGDEVILLLILIKNVEDFPNVTTGLIYLTHRTQ